MCIRGAIALRFHLDLEMMPNRTLLSPPKDDIEREGRKFTFFLAFVFDTLYSSISGVYPSNISDDDIFTKLPIMTADFDALSPLQSIPEYHQHIDDRGFFTEHEADGFHFMIKSSVLLSRVNKFKHKSQRDVIAQGKQSANQLASFFELDSLIMTYRTSVPDSWVESVQIRDGGLDIGIYMAHMVGIKAMMSLHSGFIGEQFSRNRLLTCARSIMSTIYRLLGTSWDICKLPSYVVSIYKDASEILIAAYLQANKAREVDQAESIKMELVTIAEVYRRMSVRIPVALTALRKLHTKLAQDNIPVSISEEEMAQLGGLMKQGVGISEHVSIAQNSTHANTNLNNISQFENTDFNDALLEQLAFEATLDSTANTNIAAETTTPFTPLTPLTHEYQSQNQVPNFGIAPGTAFTARDEFRWMTMEDGGDLCNAPFQPLL